MSLSASNGDGGETIVLDSPDNDALSNGLNQIPVLESFIVDNSDLERLEALISRFNIFEALGVVRHELRHSDFLAFLLDPNQSHGLGDLFVKRLLQTVARAASGTVAGLSPLHLDLMSFNRLTVHREWRRIDVFLSDDVNRLAVIVENKVDSSEHSNQLDRYWTAVTHERPGWRVIGVYLTPDGDPASDNRYVSISYADICAIIESLAELKAASLDSAVGIMLQHYAQMLRRHIVAESEVAELCRQIYAKHRAALDLIFEHRPDRQAALRDSLQNLIRGTSGLILESSSKQYIHFLPQEWDVRVLSQGEGWLKSGRMLAFEVTNAPGEMTLRLYLGPGPDETRRAIFDIARQRMPPFILPRKQLQQKWNSLFQRRLLGPETYVETSLDEQVEKLRQAWEGFVGDNLPTLTSAILSGLTTIQTENTGTSF